MFGGFYSHVDRKYRSACQRRATDAFVRTARRLAPGRSGSATRNWLRLADNPYNADLPYVIKQKALFGEASYKFGQFKLTGGGRWYDFKETRDFISGGIFSNGDTRIGDKTKSNGFTPRGIASWEPNRNLSVNLQVAKGFRLGGINDPLNIPLCTAAGPAIYGPFASATYKDETLWNYEAGVKYSKHGITFNAAAFHNEIRNLQVTVDAGSCSSRLVFNVPKAHTTGIEAEFAVHPLPGLDLSLAGSLRRTPSSTRRSLNPVLATRTGIRKGNRLPTVPKYQIAATANYGQRVQLDSDWYATASVQHVGNRYTQPGDQEPGAGIFSTPHLLRSGHRRLRHRRDTDYRFAASCRPTRWSMLGRPQWDSGLELVALRQQPVRHRSEAVARPRARRSRPLRLQYRHSRGRSA